MKDLISVVIPVYNVAAYLPECMESLLSQEHEALEVILIDDGSTDGSGIICDDYARRDSRVRVIHQKNGGAAAAKNAGLRAAAGEYLSFVDSDDYLEPGAYAHMLRLMKETGADAAECSFRDVYPSRREDQILFPERQVLKGDEYLVRFTSQWTCALLWNKLYKRELFQGVFFEEGHKIDDEYFTYQGFLSAKRVVCDGRIVYNYRRRRSSVMQSPEAAAQRKLDCIDAMTKRRKKVAEKCPQVRKVFDREYLNALVYMSQYPDNTPGSIRMLKHCLTDYIRQGGAFPPRYLWKGLLELLLTGEEALLKKWNRPTEAAAGEDFFP